MMSLHRLCNGIVLGAFDLLIRDKGCPALQNQEDDTGPDDCNHAQFGSFILAGSGCPAGEIEGAHLLDIAPTLLELGGYDVPTTMQGRSLCGQTVSVVPAVSAVTKH